MSTSKSSILKLLVRPVLGLNRVRLNRSSSLIGQKLKNRVFADDESFTPIHLDIKSCALKMKVLLLLRSG
jgi:hypothetical protein